MEKAKLEEQKVLAEQRCEQLYRQIQELTTELERTRGEYRLADALLSSWPKKATKEARK